MAITSGGLRAHVARQAADGGAQQDEVYMLAKENNLLTRIGHGTAAGQVMCHRRYRVRCSARLGIDSGQRRARNVDERYPA